MNLFLLAQLIGGLFLLLGLAQTLPLLVALWDASPSWQTFALCGGINLALGTLLVSLARGRRSHLDERDGFAIVTCVWVAAVLAGMLPYALDEAFPTLSDALFESMAGFTTTGASVLENYQLAGRAILLWRSITQWLGGMGIIVLALMILPALRVGGTSLFSKETPGPSSAKLTPRLRDTALALWGIYTLLTVTLCFALRILGMSWFEAINHSMTSIATGGFSTRPDSITSFGPAIEWAILIGMLISSMNYALHFRLLLGNDPMRQSLRSYWRNLEWRWFFGCTLLLGTIFSVYLAQSQQSSVTVAITKGFFQAATMLSSTGYVSTDYATWANPLLMLIFAAILVGGCAGSTSGGIKWLRTLLIFKFTLQELRRTIHPRVISHIRLGKDAVSAPLLASVVGFLFLFLFSWATVTFLLTLDGHDLLTATSAAASALGNFGPSLGTTGPSHTYAHLSAFSKNLLSFAMLLGRLELMTILIFLLPQSWNR